MTYFFMRASGANGPIDGKMPMFSGDLMAAQEEARISLATLAEDQLPPTGDAGFSIDVEDPDGQLLFTVKLTVGLIENQNAISNYEIGRRLAEDR